MPFIKIAGLPEKFLCDISEDLIDIVNKETDTPKKRIRIFYLIGKYRFFYLK